MTIQTIPLNKCRQSVHNVRKSRLEENLDQLEASVEAHGLLQNLVGTPAKRGFFDIFAGGRRLRVLNRLAARGVIAKDFGIPVKVFATSDADASEKSLAENFHNERMTPTDECMAFLHFLGSDGDIDAVAKRFGQTRRFVEGRLRLATLAGPVFDALAAGNMTMEIAKAYAATPDQAKQLAVFEEVKGSWLETNTHEIRKRILGASIPASHPVAMLVGEARYVEAGGRIERDLYTAAESAEWLDGQLAQQLAAAIMQDAAAKLAEESGIGTIVPLLAKSSTWGDTEHLRKAVLERAPISDEAQKRIDAIEVETSTIAERFETDELDEDEGETLNAQIEALDAERARLMDTPVTIEPERKPGLTQFVVIGADGTPTIEPGHWEAPRRLDGMGNGAAPYSDPKKIAAKAAGLTGVLADELSMARRDVLALHVASDLQVALNLAIFTLADNAVGKHGDTGTSLAVNRRYDPIAKNALPDSPSGSALAEIRNALDAEWADHDTVSARFDAFCALEDEMRASWLAVCVASSIEASLGGSGIGRHNPFHDHLGQLLEIDVAAWWRPTAGGYFARVRKAGMQQTLTDVGGPTMASRYASAKTAEMAEACEKVCSGNIIEDEDVRQAALSWLPTAMRFDAGGVTEPHIDLSSDDVASDGSDEDVSDADGAGAEDTEAQAITETPLLSKYLRLGREYPDCMVLCRMGDFYEVFGGDAVDAAKVLDIAVTSRTVDGEPVAMTGVPVHAVEVYLTKLTEAGFRVALADYLGSDDPELVRVKTPAAHLDDQADVDLADAGEPADLTA